MNDDLIERLRMIDMSHDNGEYWHTIDEAADRIEELEANKALMVQTFGNIMDDRALAYAGLSLEKLVARIDALEAENERLREALDKNENTIIEMGQKGHDIIDRLTAENERLREALAKVCLVKDHTMNPIHTIQEMRRIARAALAGKAEQCTP